MQKLYEAIEEFVRLSPEDYLLIEQLFEKREVGKKNLLLKEGEICSQLAFVEKGLLRHFINNDGVEETYYFSAENSFVCDYESLINCRASKKNIVAIEDTILHTITFKNLQDFYSKVSTGERFGRLLIEAVFSKTVNHIISSFTQPAEKRYQIFLSEFKHIQSRIPQYYIASFIGVTPQSLSRIRRQMVK